MEVRGEWRWCYRCLDLTRHRIDRDGAATCPDCQKRKVALRSG